MENWKDELKQLKLEYIKVTAPDFFELNGGYKMRLNLYSDRSPDQFGTALNDWLKYNGHPVKRIFTRAKQCFEIVNYPGNLNLKAIRDIPSKTNNVTAAIKTVINGRLV